MNFPTNKKIEGVYPITSGTFKKDHGAIGEWWDFEVRGCIDTANLTDEDLVLASKVFIADLMDDNDQCHAEIDRLTKLVDQLRADNDDLKVKNNNQAKMLNSSGVLKNRYYDPFYEPYDIGNGQKIEYVNQNGVKKYIVTGKPTYYVTK